MNNKILVFVAFGSLGDVYPLLAIAAKLKSKHNLVFLANEYFRHYVEEQSVRFHPIGKLEDQLAAKESTQSTGETKAGRVARFEHIIGNSFAPSFAFLQDLVETGYSPVVISHGNLTPAVLACEAFNIPLIITHYAPSQIPNNFEELILFETFYGRKEWLLRHITLPLRALLQQSSFDVKDSYNEHRRKHGLAPIPGLAKNLFNKLTGHAFSKRAGAKVSMEIALVPQWFCEPADQKFPHIKFVGFPFLETPPPQDDGLQKFISDHGKPLIFTPGTAVEDVEDFCAQIIPICRKLGAPGIFASKHGKAAFDRINTVDDVPLYYLEHADFASLLPQARCLIHHGGIGTLAQAVRAGIPQIVRPRMYDQSPNGFRVMLFGLGGCVAPENFNADVVVNILLHVESSPRHQEFMSYYSEMVKNESGVENCCAILEEYLSKHAEQNEPMAESLQVY